MKYVLILLTSLYATNHAQAGLPESNAGPVQSQALAQVRWIDDLGLNETQKTKLTAIWKSKRGTVNDLREQLREERDNLREIMADDSPSEEVAASYRKIMHLQNMLNDIDLASMLAIRELLTLKQREKFVEHMSVRGRLGDETKTGKNQQTSAPGQGSQ
jgi:Spy/CpxP family protein refolding chaperone